jgi:hypothetical protein
MITGSLALDTAESYTVIVGVLDAALTKMPFNLADMGLI